MIGLTIAISVVAAVAVVALIAAIDAGKMAEQALEEHGLTLDAADELFEDHEERINELEFRTPAQAGAAIGQVTAHTGTITGGGVARE